MNDQRNGEVARGSSAKSAPGGSSPRVRRFWWLDWRYGALIVLPIPIMLPDYILFKFLTVGLLILVAVGFNLLIGYSGQFVIFSAALMGVGAYGFTLLVQRGLPFFLAVILALVVTTGIGYILGHLTIRVSGIYLALASIGVAEGITAVITRWVSLTGGGNGMAVPIRSLPAWLANFDVLYIVILLVTGASLVVIWRALDGQWGRQLRAIRGSVVASNAAGVNVKAVKRSAVSITCCLWGVSGIFFALVHGFISPGSFGLWTSVQHLAMVVVGGIGTFAGPVAGTVMVGGLPEALRWSTGAQSILFAVLVFAVMFVMPEGVVGGVKRLRARSEAQDESGILHERETGSGPAEEGGDFKSPIRSPGDDLSGYLVALGTTPEGADSRKRRGDPPNVVPSFFSAEAVRVSFGGVRALDGMELTISEGEIHGLVGPNGAGKTTFLNVVSRMVNPDSGSVRFCGQDVLGLSSDQLADLGIARTFQTPVVFGRMSAVENVLIGMEPMIRGRFLKDVLALSEYRHTCGKAAKDAQNVLLLLGFGWSDLHRDVGSLAFAEQRRLELARAIVARPSLLVLDEPAAGLSEPEVEDLVVLLAELRRAGSTILLVEHNVSLIRKIADTVTVMDQGAKLVSGPPASVFSDEEVMSVYMGEALE